LEIYNFTSLFEILCAFNLAYVFTEQSKNSRFIVLIIDKILVKYGSVLDEIKEWDTKLAGKQTSLDTYQFDTKNEKNSALYNSCKIVLERERRKLNVSKDEIYKKIKSSYQTKSFSYIALYLAKYCIVILIYCGVVQGSQNTKFENTLLALNIISVLFMVIGWHFDKISYFNMNNVDQKSSWAINLIQWLVKKKRINGYNFAIIVLIAACAISFGAYYIPQSYSPYYRFYHNMLVVCTVLVPLLNFIVYFRKAANRAEAHKGNLLEQAKSITSDLPSNLKPIDDFFVFCDILQRENLELIGNGNNNLPSSTPL
jgi:hypothetical protein